MPSFDQKTGGGQQPNAAALNRTLFISDNLPILRGIDSESVDLIATDPPFNKGVKAFEGIVDAGVGRKGKKVSYKDVWTWGDVQEGWTKKIQEDHPKLHAVIQAANAAAGEDMGAFLCWLAVRVLEMHRILKPTGSLYLHIDHTAHAYAKAMLDAIFGRRNFRNEIVWASSGWNKQMSTHLERRHDAILFYAKSREHAFATPTRPWESRGEYVRKRKQKVLTDDEGREHVLSDGGGGKRVRRYLDDAMAYGVPLDDVWVIDKLNNSDKTERTGYPTQKPLALYERIVKASSNQDDLVLDPFAGCATTCVAAERLSRRWIAIDVNSEASGVILKRLRREARLPSGSQSWNRAVRVKRRAPKRTDDGAEAAPELVLVSRTRRGPRMNLREVRERLSLEDGVMCQGCGYVPPNKLVEYLEVDHRQPKRWEGSDSIRNLVLLCSPCNGTKGHKLTLAELRHKRIQEGRMLNKGWTMKWYNQQGRFA